MLTSSATLQNFQNGDIDQGGFGSDPETLDTLKGLRFANIDARVISDFGEIFVNNKNPALADKSVRQALYYGLDRQQIIDAKYKGLGQVADVFAAPTQWSFTTEGVTKYSFDPDKAGQLLDGAGWKKGADGIRRRMSRSSSCPTSPPMTRIRSSRSGNGTTPRSASTSFPSCSTPAPPSSG